MPLGKQRMHLSKLYARGQPTTVYKFKSNFSGKKILTVRIDHMDHKVSLHVWYLTCSS